MAGRSKSNESLYEQSEIEGLKYRKKRLASDVLTSEVKRPHPLPPVSHPRLQSTSSRKSKIPPYPSVQFQLKRDYNTIEGNHRLAILLSDILEQLEEQLDSTYRDFPELMEIMGNVINSVETKCKETLLHFITEREKIKQENDRTKAMLNLTETQEQELWKKAQILLQKRTENEAASAQIQYFSSLIQTIESRNQQFTLLFANLAVPKVQIVPDKFAFPMQDELLQADKLIQKKALKGVKEAVKVAAEACGYLLKEKENRKVCAHRAFALVLPVIRTDTRKLLRRIATLPYDPRFDS